MGLLGELLIITNEYIATHVMALYPAHNVRIPPMNRMPSVLAFALSESAEIQQ